MNKFSAGIFCFFMGFYVFKGIQASHAGLFDAKKKEPFGGGEPGARPCCMAKEINYTSLILIFIK
ncbi:hypothetical protein J7E50_09270 [Pedobacter sp. ISL-68]|uniref:hypothetical protein n=1 Tax=unclassified Pedobacter TaxID=2628915 RepID=UPI001BE703DC|nr:MULTISPECIES: hypothetical protein [unclassified Pedobacter]MBT2561017.1 hypothetical protein [Pedobacter sp. ISL-64]MBT2590406.1 hypothetical protein [Pedobacter sp. ISL-68]